MKKEGEKKKTIKFPTKAVLNYLKETSKNLLDFGVNIIIDPDEIARVAGFRVMYPSAPSMLYKWISNLEKGSSFEYKNKKVYLTDKGRQKIIKTIIQEKHAVKNWDGKWRAVSFDIPELNRNQRRFLRTELKLMKFKELQHSLWICPHDIEKELFALLKLWKIDFKGDIRFLKIEKIANDDDIKKYFKLQAASTKTSGRTLW